MGLLLRIIGAFVVLPLLTALVTCGYSLGSSSRHLRTPEQRSPEAAAAAAEEEYTREFNRWQPRSRPGEPMLDPEPAVDPTAGVDGRGYYRRP